MISDEGDGFGAEKPEATLSAPLERIRKESWREK